MIRTKAADDRTSHHAELRSTRRSLRPLQANRALSGRSHLDFDVGWRSHPDSPDRA